ncbi:hypothetical protein GUITHDRAFT_139311 [Guillardia theta CCMP2712]|uniref:Large ribosomal subunit protein mL53 n=1 Tax=Guillardia theta (strain CCMP2712) TaxID=905079 RepID=L1JAC0_GUITC|nr:hypothetical protein GUITHDRAFT_139311 [Guillardia theta CCMP2712]EKX45035.1 hypothetical protein GUITHDRAFT_139311 [Guillardia theta CCMP2712]|mmetsp:Transcript_39475/g.124231  ORF Transcript_39475/g.124231 Transcript_39475/m.124231 type:complete len:151 (+) Transcript_39475:62-514(+)|eukprot:XP_005832015.1 hypothetical protein GUITHDRAFT_139311 [Guillardia theta CCMP2712]
MAPISLECIKKVRITFCPFHSVPSIVEFMRRVHSPKVKASNPKCEIDLNLVRYQKDTYVKPEIELQFTDETVEKMFPTADMKIADIEKYIFKKSELVDFALCIKEMKANPVTGPIPIGSFKGRRHTYAIYGEDAEKRQRAAGGVKTSKKK